MKSEDIMRKRAFSITRKTITVAVAAALLSISAGAETLTPPRITGSMENPADDVIVTYEDITTGIDADGKDPDLSFIYVPVQPESGSPMTLTPRSLTVDNQTTAGWVPVNNLPVHIIDNGDGTSTTTASSGLYRKNGAGIATNTDAGITLDIAGDLTVNARTTAIAATAGSSITGTIGGNFTVKSQDTGIAVTEATLGDGTTQNLNLAILGPSSSITATGTGILVSGDKSTVTISGDTSLTITSDAGSAAVSEDRGNFDIKLGNAATLSLLSSASLPTVSYEKSDSYPTSDYNYFQAGDVKVENTGGGSAVTQRISFTPVFYGNNSVTIVNNSAENATIEIGAAESDPEDHDRAMSVRSDSGPVIITNNDPDGYAIRGQHSGNIFVQMYGAKAPVQITGNIEISDKGQITAVVNNGGFIHADKIDIETSMADISFWGNAEMSSRDGGKTEATADGAGTLMGLQAYEQSTAKADVTSINGGWTNVYVMGDSDWTGDVLATGSAVYYSTESPSTVYLVVTGTSTYTGNAAAEAGGDIALGAGDDSRITGDITSDGVSSLDPEKKSSARVLAYGTSEVTGDITARNSGTASLTLNDTGTKFTGDLISQSGGSITGTSAGTWTGSSSVSGGTIDFTMTDPASVWNITGNSELTTLTQNAGTINFPAAPAKSFTGTTVTVDGNYSSDGGSINMNTVFTGDSSPTDKLVIKGNSEGTATITFNRITGWGAQTVEGIKVVEVDGTSDAVFTKPDSNRLVAGPYLYDLKKVGNDWYLTSQRDPESHIVLPKADDDPEPTPDPGTEDPDPTPTPAEELPEILPPADPGDVTTHNVKPELGSYAANMFASNTLFTMSLNDRLGETRYSDALKSQKHSGNVWIRMAGGKSHTEMADQQLTNRGTWGLVQVGGDVVNWPGAGNHRFHAGLMMGYAHQNAKTRSSAIGTTSKGKISGYSAGLYATYMNAAPAGTGPYADAWLQFQKFKNKVDPSNSVEESYDSKGFTGSIEAGYTFGLKDWVSADGTKNAARLQLQAQVIRMGVRADQHIDAENFTVAGTGAGNIRTRVGATVYHLFTNEKTGRAVKPFIGLNWYHDTKTFGVTYDGIHDRIQGNRNFGELKLGVEGKLSKHVNLWGAAAYQQGSHSFRNLGAFIGAKVLF